MVNSILITVLLASCGRASAAEWMIPSATWEPLRLQQAQLAAYRAAREKGQTADQLLTRADEAFHQGHYWEMRRLYFKVADMEPDNPWVTGTLAYMVPLFRSERDATEGKDNVRYAAADFADLGGLKHKELLTIAADPTEDRFAKARSIFAWAETFSREDPDFYLEYAEYLGYGAGSYHRIHKDPRALEEYRAALQQYARTLSLIAASPRRKTRKPEAQILRDQGNTCMRLMKMIPAESPLFRTIAVKSYRRILAMADADAAFKDSARRHLTELGETI
ncbi:MAG: hypothetical protein HYZ74_03200 [Elusimicrobia bacterium]|nr:hypothetical protein [Elusimicrobiota bacterium]